MSESNHIVTMEQEGRETDQNIRLEHIRHLPNLSPPVTIRLPANLVETIIEPITEIRPRPPPSLVRHTRQIEIQY